nr:immunoglobulin light chain junction region [Macaca mulatta]MOW69952.1 immunoglobulin light chain junction region [Macaca mulatta]MOW70545.1 immunoglobulin light chain junction region [Macaca mulatta]
DYYCSSYADSNTVLF